VASHTNRLASPAAATTGSVQAVSEENVTTAPGTVKRSAALCTGCLAGNASRPIPGSSSTRSGRSSASGCTAKDCAIGRAMVGFVGTPKRSSSRLATEAVSWGSASGTRRSSGSGQRSA
jgi:hypothetical protein